MTAGDNGGRLLGLYLRLTAEEAQALDRARGDLSRQDFLRRAVLNGHNGGVPELVGSKECQSILGGLTKQQVHARSRKPDFPEPVQRLASGPPWRRADIEALASS